MLVNITVLLEKARLRRAAYSSGRREILGLTTRRDAIGFETKGDKKLVPKRKRPKKSDSILDRTTLRAKTKKSRFW